MRAKCVRLLATFFYVGEIPAAPGSAASLVTALLAMAMSPQPVVYIAVTILLTWVGVAVSGKFERQAGQKDPSCVVIDEVAGALIAFFMLPPVFSVWITAFFLFRAFDMFKIYPVNRLEQLEGGWGIMLDDLVAGLYTNIIMQIAIRWAGIV